MGERLERLYWLEAHSRSYWLTDFPAKTHICINQLLSSAIFYMCTTIFYMCTTNWINFIYADLSKGKYSSFIDIFIKSQNFKSHDEHKFKHVKATDNSCYSKIQILLKKKLLKWLYTNKTEFSWTNTIRKYSSKYQDWLFWPLSAQDTEKQILNVILYKSFKTHSSIQSNYA